MRRRQRIALWVAAALAWSALMWFIVFPWIDERFISRPAL